MPQAVTSRPVNVPVSLLWTLLIEKVELPHRFVGEVETVEILERSGSAVLRRMTVRGQTVTEWIRFDPERYEVVFTLVDHPRFEGSVINRIDLPTPPETTPRLTAIMDWEPIEDQPDLDLGEAESLLDRALAQTLKVAEDLVANAQAAARAETDGEA